MSASGLLPRSVLIAQSTSGKQRAGRCASCAWSCEAPGVISPGVKNKPRANHGKCAHCGRKFPVNPRLGKRHRYCGYAECRRVAKAGSQQRWLNRPENSGYFKGPGNAMRVRLWRAANPKRKGSNPQRVAQRFMTPRLSTALKACGVQDLNERQLALMLGMVSTLARTSVQEAIARKIRQLMFAGYAVLRTADSPAPRPARRA
ncbi:MAG: hypothetical protein RL091_2776 [Verrucomicrobiota bacterium]